MKLTQLAQTTLWLPGFAPQDSQAVLAAGQTAEIIAFPLVEPTCSPAPATGPARSLWDPLDPALHASLRGDVAKFEANLAAIALLSSLAAENRAAHDDERAVLNRFTGWGGIPKAFNPDQDDRAWKARAQSLPDVLGEDYESAKASVVNAHFTEVFVIEAMWRAVRRLGFRGGRVLEPSAGVGYFIGAMPRDLAATSDVTAVEIDRVSSRILSGLYGPHGVRTLAVGFEKARLPKDWYDLVISNVPFGNYPVPEDRNVPYANFLIHDYFFARALEVTRPGGLVAFITSAGTLDKGDDRARRHIRDRARFLGAIRLPSGTFSQIANTDVTTDIVFLQKLAEGEQAAGDWIGVSEAPRSICDTDRRLFVSSWYVHHPDLLIGRMGLKSNGFGPANAAIFDGDVGSALTERVARLPEDVYLPRAVENLLSMPRESLVAAPEFVKPGAYCLTPDGRLAISEGDALRVIDATLSTARRIRGLMAIRDMARRLLHLQPVTADDGRLGEHRAALNTAYDTFVAQHGILHATVNKRAFKGDPDLPLLLSLEDFDRESSTAEKADIFSRRTVGAVRKVERCSSADEALLVSLHERGRVDPTLMASLLGQAVEQFLPDLAGRGLIFLDPQSGDWETADAYLSGNVRDKLAMAETAGEAYLPNVEALQAVIPTDLGPGEIDARIGSTWIPSRDYGAFLDHLLECEGCTVEFNAEAGAWNIDVPWPGERSVASTQTYGTGRMTAGELFPDQPEPDGSDNSGPGSGHRAVCREPEGNPRRQGKAAGTQGAVPILGVRRSRTVRAAGQALQRPVQRGSIADVRRFRALFTGVLRGVRASSAPEGRHLANRLQRGEYPAGARRRCRQDPDHGLRRHGVAAPRPSQQAVLRGAQPHAGAVRDGVFARLSGGQPPDGQQGRPGR